MQFGDLRYRENKHPALKDTALTSEEKLAKHWNEDEKASIREIATKICYNNDRSFNTNALLVVAKAYGKQSRSCFWLEANSAFKPSINSACCSFFCRE